jgi:hypothetical protein
MGRSWTLPGILQVTLSLSFIPLTGQGAAEPAPNASLSRSAASSCSEKVQKLQDFAEGPEAGKKQTTRISESELNSYLAFELSSKYHPSLKRLEIDLSEGRLAGAAAIDFDQLALTSKSVMGKLFAHLFSGVHTLNIRGRLHAEGGKANLLLDDASFDDTTLPNFLVEEVISAVGRRQKPPFDPLKPSQMPYSIDRVDLHQGYILVHQ